MESLSEEVWDVVISGTSLPQSLLALALSKIDLKVLHVDRNSYYGGVDASLSLHEAEAWIEARKASSDESADCGIFRAEESGIGPSRGYTISLKPQIIYARSRFLPTLVSSQVHTQLEFQAVGAFWIFSDGQLKKIPSNREDVFADDSLSVRDKRRLMGLLRHVLEESDEEATGATNESLQMKLQDQFKIPQNLEAPVQALTLTTDTPANVNFDMAMSRLKRHLMSTGYFGPGLAAVMAKYGGNSEIAQVACRAGAVGGFVYLLGHGMDSIQPTSSGEDFLQVKLSDGTEIRAKRVVGTEDDLPLNSLGSLDTPEDLAPTHPVSRNISIISSPLKPIFTSTSDTGPVPAVSIVLVNSARGQAPVYLQIHSEDSGECPTGQCIIYASTVQSDSSAQDSLKSAVDHVLAAASENEYHPRVLWSMHYTSNEPLPAPQTSAHLLHYRDKRILQLPKMLHDVAFDDSILDSVKAAWEEILGERNVEHDFLRFEDRVGANEEE